MSDHDPAMIDQDHLREMIEVISGELELRPLLTSIVQKACELLHADRGSIGLIDVENAAVKIEAVYKMPPEELGSTAKCGEGLAGSVYRDRKPVLFERYGDLSSPQLQGMEDDSVVGMPIMWRGEIIGTFGIGAGPPKRFGDNDMRMLEMFARHAAIAINNARSYEREQKYAALKERQRIARDLHDSISQLIFSMSLVAQSIGPGYEQGRDTGAARTDRLMEIASLAQNEMKALLAELRGPGEGDQGSLAAFARRHGLNSALEHHCSLTAPEDAVISINIENEAALGEMLQETLLRIGQEALANAFRHGNAKSISISLLHNEQQICFRIDDNGRGLKSESAPANPTTGIGIASMRARAARAGGHLTVENRAVGGVRVELRAPLS